VIGDFGCRGVPVPALLRPETGEVWVFTGWPATGAQAGRPLGTVAGATTARARRTGTCDRIEVTTADGTTTTLD
jgi:hypothetical protein